MNPRDALLDEHLIALERELLEPSSRSNPHRVAALLHADFAEIGRSGRRWTRDEVVAALPTQRSRAISMLDARVEHVAPGVALVHYVSHDASTDRSTMRSSLWVQQDDAWRLRFHQGTDA